MRRHRQADQKLESQPRRNQGAPKNIENTLKAGDWINEIAREQLEIVYEAASRLYDWRAALRSILHHSFPHQQQKASPLFALAKLATPVPTASILRGKQPGQPSTGGQNSSLALSACQTYKLGTLEINQRQLATALLTS